MDACLFDAYLQQVYCNSLCPRHFVTRSTLRKLCWPRFSSKPQRVNQGRRPSTSRRDSRSDGTSWLWAQETYGHRSSLLQAQHAKLNLRTAYSLLPRSPENWPPSCMTCPTRLGASMSSISVTISGPRHRNSEGSRLSKWMPVLTSLDFARSFPPRNLFIQQDC